MLVQHNETKREFEMIWLEVTVANIRYTEKILKRYTKAKGESYKWHESEAGKDAWYHLRVRVIAKRKNLVKIVEKLMKKQVLCLYENWI